MLSKWIVGRILRRVRSMDWKKSLLAALKGALYVVVGGLLAAFASPEWSAALGQIGDALAGAVPVVGGLLGGVVKNLLLVGTAALVAFLKNVIQHWND